jgi:hypothetical protein
VILAFPGKKVFEGVLGAQVPIKVWMSIADRGRDARLEEQIKMKLEGAYRA